MPHTSAVPLWPECVPATDQDPEGVASPRASERPHLVPYLLECDQPRPLIVVCPGGGYHGRAAHEGEPVALWLNSLGLHAVVLAYRVWPWRHPAPLMDACRAIRQVRQRSASWQVDANKIGILGFSAGGHLAASCATLYSIVGHDPDPELNTWSPRPDALIACYPVISAGEHRHAGSFKNLIGEPLDPDLGDLLSLERSVQASNPPTFIWHTADDNAVPVENALLFTAALRRLRVPVELHVFANGRHGLGLAPETPCAAWTGLCATWLRGLGW
ncbi:acetylesterase [Planctomycetota bacterium]|nr:acetylesterase [Planctomycetota bacterium]